MPQKAAGTIICCTELCGCSVLAHSIENGQDARSESRPPNGRPKILVYIYIYIYIYIHVPGLLASTHWEPIAYYAEKVCKTLKEGDLKKLMGVSDVIAKKDVERYNWARNERQ